MSRPHNRLRHQFIAASACAVLFSTLATSSASAQVLLSRYTLDGVTTDSGSVGADGSLFGTAAYINNAPGDFTQSLNVNGAGSNYMQADVGSAYSGLQQLTVTFWVNLQGAPAENERFVSNMEASSFDGFDIRAATGGSADSFRALYNVNQVSSPSVSTDISADNAWAFVAVTYDATLGANQVSYYAGSEVIATSFLNSGNQSGALDASSLLRVGGTPASGSDRTPPAYFSDVRVYSGVLNLAQIEDVRASVYAVPEPAAFTLIGGMLALLCVACRRR